MQEFNPETPETQADDVPGLTEAVEEAVVHTIFGGPRAQAEFPHLPRRIAGGLRGLEEDVERRGRDIAMAVRMMEQYRIQMETAERDHEEVRQRLDAAATEARETSETLRTMLDATKQGDSAGNLATQFDKTLRAAEDLEKISQAATANLMWMRTAWEQYARSIVTAHKTREAIR